MLDRIGCFCPVQVVYWTGMGKSTIYGYWTGGRVEIHTYESEFDIDEKHFCTPRTEEWRNFEEKYDGEWVDKDELKKVIEMLREKFYRVDKNYDPIL